MGLEYNALSVSSSLLGLIDHHLTAVAVVSRSLSNGHTGEVGKEFVYTLPVVASHANIPDPSSVYSG